MMYELGQYFFLNPLMFDLKMINNLGYQYIRMRKMKDSLKNLTDRENIEDNSVLLLGCEGGQFFYIIFFHLLLREGKEELVFH